MERLNNGDKKMITKAVLKNFGPLIDIKWDHIGSINLIIGANGNGKTFLLKSLYCATRTLEEYKRGNEYRTAAEILFDKLYWTFQVEKIGDLVTKGAESKLSASITFDQHEFQFTFGKETAKQINFMENHVTPLGSNSLFLPAKEVLSLQKVILRSRETYKDFGFDDTYLDLARALRQTTKQGKNIAEFSKSRDKLKEIVGGRLEYEESSEHWIFRNEKNQKFEIGVTAEGIKKIAILDTLLVNRYLDRKSILFIDEPESALHPAAISKLLDIIALLAESGIQFFLASHSYFVIKKLYLIAQEKQMSIPVMSCENDEWRCDDLKEGMPENSIIDESIRLYKEQVDRSLKW
jgi:AAA15 family ATPase/GTPase